MANKITRKDTLNFVLDNCNLPQDHAENIRGMIAALDRKAASAVNRKPSAHQNENAALLADALAFLRDNAPSGFTVTDIIKGLGREDVTNQRLSALLQPKGVPVDGIRKDKDSKRHTLFFAVIEAD